jgi:carboxyl-terminal processing protease
MTQFVKYTLIAYMMFCAAFSYGADDSKQNNSAEYKEFQRVFEKIQHDYVKVPNKQEMTDAAIAGMLSSLDPHSMYFKDEDFDDFVNQVKGEFGGIGVEIMYEGNFIKIISPIDDLAAYKAGIQAGDYIIAVNGDSVAAIGQNKAVRNLRGDPGTKVKVTIFRDGENKPREFELVRELVQLKPVKSSRDGDIAYIRIVTFNEQTIVELTKAMKSILEKSKNPIKGIILDVRNNPGGILEQGVGVAEYFVDSGVIVTTKGRIEAANSSFSASQFKPKAPKVPMVVLINGGSASASEIVAGALQDYKRAVLIGTTSFGKGSVQAFMPLDKRSAMKLTIAKYYTPKGRSIQGEGIEPDIIVEQAKVEYPKHDETEKRFSEAVLRNHLKNDDQDDKAIDTQIELDQAAIEKQKDEKKDKAKAKKSKIPEMSDMYKNDYQYSRAYDLIYGLSLGAGEK